jgi:hypothetical protein
VAELPPNAIVRRRTVQQLGQPTTAYHSNILMASGAVGRYVRHYIHSNANEACCFFMQSNGVQAGDVGSDVWPVWCGCRRVSVGLQPIEGLGSSYRPFTADPLAPSISPVAPDNQVSLRRDTTHPQYVDL